MNYSINELIINISNKTVNIASQDGTDVSLMGGKFIVSEIGGGLILTDLVLEINAMNADNIFNVKNGGRLLIKVIF